MKEMKKCPLCGRENADNRVVYISEDIVELGGCDDCWQKQVDADLKKLDEIAKRVINKKDKS